MKGKKIFFSIAIGAVLLTSSKVYGQLNPQVREQGPLFITSVAFAHGVHRFPYNVVPGEEYEIKNTTTANIPVISVSQFMGFQFSPYIALGIGLNFEYWTVKNAFVPIYLDVRGSLMKTNFAPHWYVNLGFANHWNITSIPYKLKGNSSDYVIQGSTSGFMGELGFGFKASVSRNAALVITAFAKVQETSLRYYDGTPPQRIKSLLVNTNANGMYMFAGLKAGIMF
ncbi:MAG: hypothetical protein LBR36_09835 [Bacteroidales bacterium]|jgi:hypothetical protein|nr:hypothetical protein [Bacteroidales bacterium]